MLGSLKDQLLNAGFSEKKQPEKKRATKPARGKSSSSSRPVRKSDGPSKRQRKPATKTLAKPVIQESIVPYTPIKSNSEAKKAGSGSSASAVKLANKRAKQRVREQVRVNQIRAEQVDGAVTDELRVLIKKHSVANDQGTSKFHFQIGNKITYVYVKPEIQVKLEQGVFIIVQLDGQFCLVEHQIADQLIEAAPHLVVFRNTED